MYCLKLSSQSRLAGFIRSHYKYLRTFRPAEEIPRGKNLPSTSNLSVTANRCYSASSANILREKNSPQQLHVLLKDCSPGQRCCIVKRSYSLQRFHPPDEKDSHDKRKYIFDPVSYTVIAAALISLLTFTSYLFKNFNSKCLCQSVKIGKGNCYSCSVKSFIKDLSSSFNVHAAKPFSDDNPIKEKADSKKTGESANLSRRKQFNFIADVLEVVEDAVVCIEVKDHSTVNWFGMPQNSSNGSGFIVKEDGLILTNAHVVASQQRCSISVKLKDGRCFPGYVEDVDYESDLATVRVKARELPTLKLGCSSETRVGEWVVAVGSPLNLSNTVTAGIVSTTRKAHELGIQQNDINYIQTDAAITFGNSGGPLINLDCEVIGINSMKVTPGISFAIPIDHAKVFLERAEKRRAAGNTRSRKRYMGLTILSLTDQIRRELESRTGYSVVNQGVFVWQVVRGGPAHLGGIQPGDVMISINGQQIVSASQVHEIVKTDDRLIIEVQRGSHFYTFTIVPENVNE